MRKRNLFCATLLLLFLLPATVLAEEETAPPSSQADTETATAAGLAIDNTHIYAGMDKAYEDGYTPAVQDGEAKIVLPLVASGEIVGDSITATPDLGGTANSPFVYSNYQKTVALAENTVNGGGTVASYLVRFDLPLAAERYNGTYLVTIRIEAQSADGSLIQESYPVYVTITDGKNADDDIDVQASATPTSQPKIIVESYSVNPSPAVAGEECVVTITLKNTNTKAAVQNMILTASCDSPNFSLQNKRNVLYIDDLGKGKSMDIELTYKIDLETPAQRYNILLSIEYDNSEAATLNASGSVPVEVSQPLRVEMEVSDIEKEVNAGDTMSLSFQVMNLGRSAIYNVRVTLSVPGLLSEGTVFFGNMEAGTSMPEEINVFIGTKDMTEGYEDEEQYGRTDGTLTLLYEDAAGNVYTQETAISTYINEPVIVASTADSEEEPEKAGQWWVSVLIGGAAIAGGIVYFTVYRKRREKKDADL